MGHNVNILNPDYKEKSWLAEASSTNKSKPGTFTSKEMNPAANSKVVSDNKARELVGNCPMKHDHSITHKATPSKRETALNACFGSSFMTDCLHGANKSQMRNDQNTKPTVTKYEAISEKLHGKIYTEKF